LGETINIVKKNTEALLNTSKEVGLKSTQRKLSIRLSLFTRYQDILSINVDSKSYKNVATSNILEG
jgi:hypothetical protein